MCIPYIKWYGCFKEQEISQDELNEINKKRIEILPFTWKNQNESMLPFVWKPQNETNKIMKQNIKKSKIIVEKSEKLNHSSKDFLKLTKELNDKLKN